jgi:hypothetical protein
MMYGILAIIISFFGFAALAFSLERHYAQISDKKLTTGNKVLFRLVGWVLLAVSVAPCIAQWETAIGISAWFLIASVSGSILVLILSFADKR